MCGSQLAIIHGTVLALAHLSRIVWVVWWEVWTPLVLQCDIDWPSSGPTTCSIKSIVFGGWRWGGGGPAQDPQQPNRSCPDLRLQDTKWGMIRAPNVIAPDYGYKRWSTNREACRAYIQPGGIGYLVRVVFYDQIFKPNSVYTSDCKQGSLMADNYNLIEGLTYIRGQNKVYVPFSYYGRSTIRTMFKKQCEIFTAEV